MHTSIEALEARIVAHAKSDERMRRLQTIPGVGPIIAHALVSAIGDPRRFATARDCAAWVGLTPLTNNSAEKTRIGHISRQGDHSLRRLLVLGAANLARRAKAKPNPANVWLHGVIARRPFKVATVAQAAKTARIAWALLCSGDNLSGDGGGRVSRAAPQTTQGANSQRRQIGQDLNQDTPFCHRAAQHAAMLGTWFA